jgi:hypothetical protein
VKTILFAWELGAGLGHAKPFAEIAKGFVDSGSRIYVAAAELLNAQIAFAGIEVSLLQAPTWPSHRHFGSQTGEGGYLDILASLGFADPMKLGSVVSGWLSLLDLTRPDVVVADHSPAAMIACHIRGLPVILAGTCYLMPPLDFGRFPPLKADRAPVMPEARLYSSAAQISKAHGSHPPASLIEYFRTADRFVFGIPELDPYAPLRREPLHLPPEGLAAFIVPPVVPRIFLYLSAEMSGLDEFVQAIVQLGFPIEAYFGRDIAPLGRFLALAGHTVHDKPPALADVLIRASHVVSESGAYTSMNTLAAGRPLLGLVPHGEGEFNISTLEKLGTGRRMGSVNDERDIGNVFLSFIKDHTLQQKARHWAKIIALRSNHVPSGRDDAVAAIHKFLR